MTDEQLTTGPSLAEFWEGHYSGQERIWSGKPNAVLVEVVSALPPGRALDLGCGEGGDAVWLAERGWRVTAVDVSATALERVTAHAAEAGVGDLVQVERHNLAESLPEGPFDLVSAHYLQAPEEYGFPRDRMLRAAADTLAPGGLLLVVDHASAPSWSWHHGHQFPTAAETLAGLALDPAGWTTELAHTPERVAVGPEGQTGAVLDNVIAVRRN